MLFNKFVDGIIGIIMTIVSIIKSDFFIEQMGFERFGLFVVLVIVMTLVLLSDSPKENR